MIWDKQEMAAAASRHDRESEFERRRRERMQHREVVARLYRPTGNVIAFPSRAPVDSPPPDIAA